MPISLPPLSRRRFLYSALAAGAGLILRPRWGWSDSPSSGDHLALLSDVHIAADPAYIIRGVNTTEHLRHVSGEILALADRPSGVLINGDCALLKGQQGDYVNLVAQLAPLREAGMSIHLGLGNHDNREAFRAAIPEQDPAKQQAELVAERQVLLLEMPTADWIMLDSLDRTNSTPGVLGERQIRWLAATLDERKASGRPVIVMVHHQPSLREPAPPSTAPTTEPALFSGLTDYRALMDVLLPRRQVKLLLFGHTHRWSEAQVEGMHLVNLPAVAYGFKEGQLIGWTDCHVTRGGATLRLSCLEKGNALNGHEVALTWRA